MWKGTSPFLWCEQRKILLPLKNKLSSKEKVWTHNLRYLTLEITLPSLMILAINFSRCLLLAAPKSLLSRLSQVSSPVLGVGMCSQASPIPVLNQLLGVKSLIAICYVAAAKLELCGASCRDEKNPEASRFCTKPNSCRTQGHKNGEKASYTPGIYVRDANTKRIVESFFKPPGSISLLETHRFALCNFFNCPSSPSILGTSI